ncbi:hypothetical protein COOONC_04969 [Cooperia oncophora]
MERALRKENTKRELLCIMKTTIPGDTALSAYPDGHHHHGSRSGSVDDYTKGSATSDEYKRRMHETREKLREQRRAETEDSSNFYKILAAALALLIVFDVKYTMNLEVMRYQLGVLTENIDCSLHMK